MPFTLAMSSNAATWLLSTVAGAMITTVGVVFSLTVVSLQLASDQFSPRVMRSFIRDRLSQGVIGLLVGTFFYCVLTLPNLSGESTAPAPRVSLTVAVALTVVTVVGIIAHHDHLARGLQVGNVARTIAVEGEGVVASLGRLHDGLDRADPTDFQSPRDAVLIESRTSGWISQVGSGRLLRAVPAGTIVRLETRVGAYIHAGEPLVTVWPSPSPRAQERIDGAIEVTDARTMLQDVDFAIRQLVDIGLRALSPAVNDPTTAVEVILRLGSLLRRLLTAGLAPPAVQDGRGRVLVQPWPSSSGCCSRRCRTNRACTPRTSRGSRPWPRTRRTRPTTAGDPQPTGASTGHFGHLKNDVRGTIPRERKRGRCTRCSGPLADRAGPRGGGDEGTGANPPLTMAP